MINTTLYMAVAVLAKMIVDANKTDENEPQARSPCDDGTFIAISS
jgi:hypothetical protein